MAIWNSADSRCIFNLVEGIAVIQELAWGEETESMRALFTGEAEDSREWNAKESSIWDSDFC
jgi:hypothetical protein